MERNGTKYTRWNGLYIQTKLNSTKTENTQNKGKKYVFHSDILCIANVFKVNQIVNTICLEYVNRTHHPTIGSGIVKWFIIFNQKHCMHSLTTKNPSWNPSIGYLVFVLFFMITHSHICNIFDVGKKEIHNKRIYGR